MHPGCPCHVGIVHAPHAPCGQHVGPGAAHGVGGVGYTNHNGGYVQPYERTVPNGTQTDNYGTRGNVNPYTGTFGTRSPRY